MTPQDKQPGKHCDKCLVKDRYLYSGCSNPICPCHQPISTKSENSLHSDTQYKQNQQPGLEEVLKEAIKNFREKWGRFYVSDTVGIDWEKPKECKHKSGVMCLASDDIEKDITDFISHAYSIAYKNGREEVGKEIEDCVIGSIVKNSTGFDTIGNKRLWHLDIDKFEKSLSDLISTLKSNE